MNLVLTEREKSFVLDMIDKITDKDVPNEGRRMINSINDRLLDGTGKLKPAQRYFLELVLYDVSKKLLDSSQKDDSVKDIGYFAKALALKIRKSVPDDLRKPQPPKTPSRQPQDEGRQRGAS